MYGYAGEICGSNGRPGLVSDRKNSAGEVGEVDDVVGVAEELSEETDCRVTFDISVRLSSTARQCSIARTTSPLQP